jgi:hypothetical protein
MPADSSPKIASLRVSAVFHTTPNYATIAHISSPSETSQTISTKFRSYSFRNTRVHFYTPARNFAHDDRAVTTQAARWS